MKARASEPAKTAVAKRCLTTNELSKGFPFGPRRMSCTRTAVNSSNNKVDLSVECMDNGLKTDGTLEIEALNPENVKGVLQLAVTGGDPSTNSSSTFSARWLGSVCSAIK